MKTGSFAYMNKKRMTAALLSAALLSSAAVPGAFGPMAIRAYASPSFARTAEEWAVLQDNKLTWEEIPDLVAEYNATVRDNEQAYADDERNMYDAQDIREALIDQADDLDVAAMDMAGTSEASAAQYRAQANQLRDQADDNVTDRDIIRWNYDSIEASIVLNAKLYFLNYYSSMEQAKKARTAYDTAVLNHTSTVNRFNAGIATQMDVLTAKESMQTAEATIVTADAAVDSARKLLQVTCGWSYDSEAEIGELPQMDFEKIASIDLAADTEAAKKNNYTLRSDERMLKNTDSSNNFVQLRTKYEKKIKDDTDQVSSSVRTAYDTLKNAKQSYDNAVSQRGLAANSAALAERNYALGTISAAEYQTAAKQLETAVYDEEIARIAVMSAWTSYDAAIAGLASAGQTG